MDFLRKYLSISASTVFPEGLICKQSLRAIQIRSFIKLELNNMQAENMIKNPSLRTEKFRELFARILSSVEGDYINFESLKKSQYLNDKEAESKDKTSQIALKNNNITSGKNFQAVCDVLKLCAENLLLPKHSGELKSLFGLGEAHDVVGQLLPNFVSYFIRYKLISAIQSSEIRFLLAQVAKYIDTSSENAIEDTLLSILNLGAPGIEQCIEGQELPHVEKNGHNGIMNGADFSFGPGVEPRLVQSNTEGDKVPLNEMTPERSPRNIDHIQLPLPVNTESTNALLASIISPKKDQSQETKVESAILPQGTLDSKLKLYYKGCEELKTRLLSGLLDYHNFKQQEKKAKRDLLKRALESLAKETHKLLLSELQKSESVAEIENELKIDPKVTDAKITVVGEQRACVLCNHKDSHPVCGRLIHLKKNEWIHTNCAAWSDGVSENTYGGGGLINVYQVIKKARASICPECNLPGASMLGHTDVNKRYHLVCALKNKCVFTFAITERKIWNMDCWLKNSISNYQKHYKFCSIIYFIFCQSMEMITTFRCSRRLFVIKKHHKGIVTEAVKSDAILDLAGSIRELSNKKKLDSEVESKGIPRPLMSRIGNLLLLSLKDITQCQESHMNLIYSNKVKQQYLLSLRKEGLPQADEYCENKRELYCLLLKRFVVARMYPEYSTDLSEAPKVYFKIFELNCDVTRQNIYQITVKKLSQISFQEQMNRVYEEKNSDFVLESEEVETVEPSSFFNVLYEDMGFCYGEIRAYLFNSLKSALDKLKQSQTAMKTYQHFQTAFYNSIEDQQILLDIGDKYSIYDRIKLIWQINSDLENSKEFMKESQINTSDKHKVGARSRVNPKSRSFGSRNDFSMSKSSNCRMSERLIQELCNPVKELTNEQHQQQVRPSKRKNQPQGQKLPEKSNSVIRKGYLTYKTQYTTVAPSNIHKYGNFRVTKVSSLQSTSRKTSS
jgi:hypothetical protein